MTATSSPAPPATRITRFCAEGRHRRCLGVVNVVPAVKGRHLAPCECTAPDCHHNTRD